MRSIAAVILILVALPLEAEDRYLLPVFTNVRGAYESLFVSELSLMTPLNPVEVRGLALVCDGILCPPTGPSPRRLHPGTLYTSFPASGRPGLVLKAPEGADLRMALRVRDTSRNEFSAGTEIPVVHESEFIEGALYLLSIPPEGSRFRNRLRVYAFASGVVSVIFIGHNNAFLQQTTLRLEIPDEVPAAEAEFLPAFAETADFPVSGSPMWMHIQPGGDIGGIWAFVTTTNNETQEITTVTPQP